MQANIEQNLTDFEGRVQHLHVVTGQTWTHVAASLQVSRTMLHYYRTGQHPPDAQVLHRLREAERHAGIRDGAHSGLGDHPLDGGQSPFALGVHLRWLRGALLRQQEVVASAQRHLLEIEGWMAAAETELAHHHSGLGESPVGDEGAAESRVTAGGASRQAPAAAQKRVPLRDIASVSLPIFGYLPAGFPQSSEGVRQQHAPRSVRVRKGRFPEGAFGLEVRGESMNAATPEPILHGDTVVLVSPEQREPKSGDIVAALIDGETCLKRLANGDRPAHLRSESDNPAYRAIYPVHELVIQGVMVGKL